MSSINGVGNHSPVQKVVSQPIYKQLPADASSPSTKPTDKLELSRMSHLLKALKSNDIRVDKVQQIKQQIEAGTYEDEHKLDVTTERLLDDLMKD
jgi:anti-sigma28 factor (negative regulator of flagellin synthesis)